MQLVEAEKGELKVIIRQYSGGAAKPVAHRVLQRFNALGVWLLRKQLQQRRARNPAWFRTPHGKPSLPRWADAVVPINNLMLSLLSS
ncbi:hypothetical protein GCM10027404_19770 [Arthrobacter tumbae]